MRKREALRRYLALPSAGSLRTIVEWKAYLSPVSDRDPRFLDLNERTFEGLRKAGMPEE